jgi:hypothetical protein
MDAEHATPIIAHVFAGDAPESAAWLALAAASVPGVHHWFPLAPGPASAALLAMGIHAQTTHHLEPRSALAALAPQVIIDWGGRAARLGPAARACPVLRVLVDAHRPHALQPGVRTLAMGHAIADAHTRAGHPPDGIWPWPTHAPATARREAARAALGIDPDDRAVLMLCDPAEVGSARRFVHVLGVLSLAGVRVVGLMPAHAGHAARAHRFTHLVGHRWRLQAFEGPQLEAAAAADLCLWDRGLSPTPEGTWADPMTGGGLAVAALAQGARVLTVAGTLPDSLPATDRLVRVPTDEYRVLSRAALAILDAPDDRPATGTDMVRSSFLSAVASTVAAVTAHAEVLT